MPKLALILVLLAGGVAAAWLALRTPRSEPPNSLVSVQVVETPVATVEPPPETNESLATSADHEREPVAVETDSDGSDASPVRSRKDGKSSARIRVLDGATSKPVEYFGARASRRAASTRGIEGVLRVRRLPKTYRDGLADIAATPAEDVLQVIAPGYAPFEGELVAAAFSGVQTIELARGGSLTGRVMLRELPAKSVRIHLERARVLGNTADPSAEPFDLSRLAGSPRSKWSGRDGRFLFDALALGTYELDFRAADGSRLSLADARVTNADSFDLGDLELVPAATLLGRLQLPDGASTRDLLIRLSGVNRNETLALEGRTNFEFGRLGPGKWTLSLRELQGGTIDDLRFEYELAAGETREVLLDMRERVGTRVDVRVLVNGRPVEGAVVRKDDEYPQRRYFRGTSTSQDGRLSWWQIPEEQMTLIVNSDRGLPLGAFDLDVRNAFSRGEPIELTVVATELSVDWHQLTLAPEFEGFSVSFHSVTDDRVFGHTNGKAGEGDSGVLDTFARREFDVGLVVSGQFDVSIVFGAKTPTRRKVLFGPDGNVEFTRKLTLRPGERAVCSLTDADRVE